MFFLPPLLLLFFYSFNKKHLIWLTIPITELAVVICFWDALAYYETRGLILLALISHTVIVSGISAITVLIKHIRLKRIEKLPPENAKRSTKTEKIIIIITAASICFAAAGFVAHTVLSNTSDSYRQNFDQETFSQLTKIKPEDILEIKVYDFTEKFTGVATYADYQGDKTFFSDLEYTGSLLSKPAGQLKCGVSIALKNGDFVSFTLCEDDEFQVQYKDKAFFVKSPQLLNDISK